MSEDLTKQMPSDDLRSILARLDRLEDKVDKRLQETRPIWERVLAELSEVRTEVSQVHTEMNQVHTEINELCTEMREGFKKVYVEMDNGMRLVARQVDVLNRNVLEVRADIRYLDRRITKLEGEPAP